MFYALLMLFILKPRFCLCQNYVHSWKIFQCNWSFVPWMKIIEKEFVTFYWFCHTKLNCLVFYISADNTPAVWHLSHSCPFMWHLWKLVICNEASTRFLWLQSEISCRKMLPFHAEIIAAMFLLISQKLEKVISWCLTHLLLSRRGDDDWGLFTCRWAGYSPDMSPCTERSGGVGGKGHACGDKILSCSDECVISTRLLCAHSDWEISH